MLQAASMSSLPQPEQTREEEVWLDRVDSLAPLVTESRAQAEADRSTPARVIGALREAGIPRMWVSTEFGGEQVSLATGSAVIRALARLDASVAWQMGVQGAIARLSDYLPEDTARELFKNHVGLVVGAVNPAGQAEKVAGGYRISGTWAFASGSAHADWLVCASFVTEDGTPVPGRSGPAMRMLFIPRDRAEILDTWYTVGLRGTGSNHYRVDGVFVPEEYTVDRDEMLTAPAPRLSRGYAVGYYDFGPFTSASTALGIARDALDTFRALAMTKTPTGAASVLSVSHTVQEKLARAEMLVRCAEVLLADTARHVERLGERGGEDLSALVRLTAATVAENTAAAVDIAYVLAGSSSLYTTSRLERCFRDINSAVKHITLSPSNIEMVGQYMLGGGLQLRR